MPYSTCCGAYTDMDEIGICPDCLEHCDWEDEEDEEKTISVLDLINRIQSKIKEVDAKIKESENKTEKVMTFTEWLMERQKEAK